MLRRMRRVGARFVAFIRADFSGVRAGFFALLISSGGDLVTGVTFATISNTLNLLPGLVVLVPAAIGMRGNVFGGLGSRLGTMIHTGTFRVSTRIDTEVGQNTSAASLSSLATAPLLAFLAMAGVVDLLAGITIQNRFTSLLKYPALLVMVPAFLEDSGSLGAILAARVSTKLHLGTLGDRGASWRAATDDVMLVYLYAIPVFAFLGLTSKLVANVLNKAHTRIVDMLG